MRWFKGTEEGDAPVSNANSDTGASRPEPRLWQAESRQQPALITPVPVAPPPPPVQPEVKRMAEIPASPAPKPLQSVFGASLRFKGELRADEDIVLQGRVDGSIHHTQNLTIGTEGVVKGNSRARCITVDGTVDGDLYALESISIRPTARVQGNLLAPRVAIADGATFNGKVDMASAARAAQAIAERHSALPDERTAEQLLLGGEKK